MITEPGCLTAKKPLLKLSAPRPPTIASTYPVSLFINTAAPCKEYLPFSCFSVEYDKCSSILACNIACFSLSKEV